MLRIIAVHHNLRVKIIKPVVMAGNYFMKVNAVWVCYIFFFAHSRYYLLLKRLRHLFPPFRSSCFPTSGWGLDAHKRLGHCAACISAEQVNQHIDVPWNSLIFANLLGNKDTRMARIFRRAANKVKNSRDGHVSLGLLIFDEKVVYENFQKAAIAKADGK